MPSGPDTWMVAFALVSSSTGELADAAAVSAAARATGARVLVDVTQATGWLPTTDLEADLVVCHTYKWLCAPRGSAFAAFSERAQEEIRPLTAGWYSAADPWASCYGPELDLAPDASRYDVSPAWHAWVGAEAALGFAVSLDAAEVRDHAVGLANGFRERLDLGPSDSAIVSWPDPDGAHLAAFGRGRRRGLRPRRPGPRLLPPLERRGGRRPGGPVPRSLSPGSGVLGVRFPNMACVR